MSRWADNSEVIEQAADFFPKWHDRRGQRSIRPCNGVRRGDFLGVRWIGVLFANGADSREILASECHATAPLPRPRIRGCPTVSWPGTQTGRLRLCICDYARNAVKVQIDCEIVSP